jgi:predicted nucleic acid-binding protein
LAGRLINELRDVAIVVNGLSTVTASPDPYNNYLLATALAGEADFIVTGDKRDLLVLRVFQGIKIVSVRELLAMHGRLP